MSLEGIAAPSVGDVPSLGWLFSRSVQKRISTGQDISEYYVNVYR